ncbi:hypothetical protein N7467_006586 [Penicillium canescens]|nr:hypothetical protein N7467_006586 [Penicillium canescens]
MVTAVQLIPIAATIIVSSTGAEVAEILSSHGRAFGTGWMDDFVYPDPSQLSDTQATTVV